MNLTESDLKELQVIAEEGTLVVSVAFDPNTTDDPVPDVVAKGFSIKFDQTNGNLREVVLVVEE